MPTISLCMIVKNEEDVLERCLKSVFYLVDEIIIVDTGSDDNTKNIAAKFTKKIYDFNWEDDFASARNFAFEKASCDYLFWLDADDVLLEKDQKEFQKMKQTLSADVVMLPYNVGFDKNMRPVFSYERERLFKKDMNFLWKGAVHEVIVPRGTIAHGKASITHLRKGQRHNERNLRIYQKLLSKEKNLTPREQYYYARELTEAKAYKAAIPIYEKFLENKNSWDMDCVGACIQLSNCYTAIKQSDSAMHSLFHSFKYDVPCPEICCKIGDYFFNNNNYTTAIFWYTLACQTSELSKYQFYNKQYSDYIPYLQLCVCYDKLQEYDIANFWNEKAGSILPDSFAYLYNKKYFEQKLNERNLHELL
ncbi:MAG: glycosyltransferase family 2 protein [Ruminococcus sp.]|nr:glycosyltransferase family 2 protein [Ruminococcus sp.]